MTSRKIALGIGIAIAIAIVVVFLTQHGITIRIPWITKKPRIIILRPEGYKIQTIQPGITYKIEAPHSIVYTSSSVNNFDHGLEIWVNISKITTIGGNVAPAFSVTLSFTGISIYKPGKYLIVYKPLKNEYYYLSILINDTYNCTMIGHVNSSKLQAVSCDLPTYVDGNWFYIYLPHAKHIGDCITIKRGNVTGTICGVYNPYEIIEMDIGASWKNFAPTFTGELTFKFKTTS